MKPNNFDNVAFVYDRLARMFFGNYLRKAPTYFLNEIPPQSKALVIGCGTGWIAMDILKLKPDTQITLLDASQKMIELAQKNLKGKSVTILCGDENQQFPEPFDVIILPFFLDLFPDKKSIDVIKAIQHNSKPESYWLVTDFVSERWWHRIYLWIMYRFFKLTCAIEASGLPDWQYALEFNNILVKETQAFYGGFICSLIGYPQNK